jgi:hypothetical protein
VVVTKLEFEDVRFPVLHAVEDGPDPVIGPFRAGERPEDGPTVLVAEDVEQLVQRFVTSFV